MINNFICPCCNQSDIQISSCSSLSISLLTPKTVSRCFLENSTQIWHSPSNFNSCLLCGLYFSQVVLSQKLGNSYFLKDLGQQSPVGDTRILAQILELQGKEEVTETLGPERQTLILGTITEQFAEHSTDKLLPELYFCLLSQSDDT